MINVIREKKGLTLIELIVVIAIIGILAAIGLPEYGRFAARSQVRRAASDLQQNMKLTRTLAIKENRSYLITFNENAGENIYRIGFDGDNNNSLRDVADGYETGPVRGIDVYTDYGINIALGTTNFEVVPQFGPNAITVANTTSFEFLPDGSTTTTGTVYLQHTGRGFTYCVQLVNLTGLINLFIWDGDIENQDVQDWTQIR